MAKKQQEEHGESYGSYVRRQYRKNTFGYIALYIVAVIIAFAVFADFLANDKPLLASYNGRIIMPVLKSYAVSMHLTTWAADESFVDWRNLNYNWSVFPPVRYSVNDTDTRLRTTNDRKPSAQHWLGVDNKGRDILAGIIHGARYALSIGLVAMGIALLIGIIAGALAGYFGGWVDIVISRIIEIIISMPTFFVIITVVAMLQDIVQDGRLFLIMAVIGFINWTSIARLVRGEVLRVRNLDFITAAQALGFSKKRIIFLHVLPNAIGPVLVSAAFGIASAILIESSLSFLGLGVPPTTITWGALLSTATADINAWWVGVFPGLMIFLTVVAYNFIGDALRDATDPRLRS